MKRKIIKHFVVFVIAVILLNTLYFLIKEPTKISDIVSNKHEVKRVFLLENGNYEPYVVAHKNYQEHVLLYREKVLTEDATFDEASSYYNDSEMDRYLEQVFIKSLDESLQSLIEIVAIQIMKEDSIGIAGDQTEWINRKVFLLGYEELNYDDTGFTPKEGQNIPLLNTGEKRIAYDDHGPRGWWLRTSYTAQPNSAFVIFSNGNLGPAIVNEKFGVRPAFCIPRDTLIYAEIIENKEAYVLESVD